MLNVAAAAALLLLPFGMLAKSFRLCFASVVAFLLCHFLAIFGSPTSKNKNKIAEFV